MLETRLFVVRHGKTMFNTLGRAQGWCDSPLTTKGLAGIRAVGRGLKASGLIFDQAVTSDSGRTIETLKTLLDQQGQTDLPHLIDPRIREWCFGSLEGLYDAELFHGVLPRAAVANGQSLSDMTYPEIAASLYELDTADWAEPWEELRQRILTGFGDIATRQAAKGGGNVLVVSHGMTIATLVWLLDPTWPRQDLANGSVTTLTYRDGQLIIDGVGDLSYQQLGKETISDEEN